MLDARYQHRSFFGRLRTKALNSQRALIGLWCVC
jgi:hypothetical protein